MSPDRAALAALYNATDGVNWRDNTNWLSDAPIGEWGGVSTNDSGRVTALGLQGNQLRGEIPPELGTLANLEWLGLGDNQLIGKIPPELGSLANLELLELGRNGLSGEIPPELARLANLTELLLYRNELSGQIPSWLGSLAKLKVLSLSENRFTGCISRDLRDVRFHDLSLLDLPFCSDGSDGASPAAKPTPKPAVTPTLTPTTTPVVLKATTAWPITSESSTQWGEYIKEINRRANGALVLDFVGGPDVVHLVEGFNALRAGIVDLVHTSPGYFVGEIPEGAAFSMLPAPPALSFQDIVDAWHTTGALDLINGIYEQKAGVRSIGFHVGGRGFGFIMVDEINSVAELKGKRIRVWDAMGASIVAAAGAAPQTIPASELYTALQRGAVDGALRDPFTAWSQGERGVYTTIVRPPIFTGPGGGFISAQAWNSLSPDLQNLLMDTSYELAPSIFEWYARDEQFSVNEFAKVGTVERTIPLEEWKVLHSGHQKHWDTVGADFPAMLEIKALLQRYLDKALANLDLD